MDTQTADKALPKGIRRQISLPWSKSFDIALKNLKVRFSRHLITVASLVLAVSFLSFVFASAEFATGFAVAGGEAAREALVEAGYDVGTRAQGYAVGASAKDRWIVILSLLVCAVGIVNAQLMAVTERFREIGIIKCLGALDSIVLRLFLIEAALQGLAGAAVGAALGLVAAALLALFRFGFAALAGASYAAVGGSLLMAVGIGLGLSLFGVFYPAMLAARMKPVDALRSEH